MKNSKCYLDKRYNCKHPDERKFCVKNTLCCAEMDDLFKDWTELMRSYKWRERHRGYVDKSNFEEGL